MHGSLHGIAVFSVKCLLYAYNMLIMFKFKVGTLVEVWVLLVTCMVKQ